MIHWLIQSDQDVTLAPQDWLSAVELERYNGFRFDKRKRDWGRGRWTAKQLIRRVIRQAQARSLALSEIEISNDGDGVPFAMVDEQRLQVTLSLSHSRDHALGAVALSETHDQVRLGCDLEYVETRDTILFRDYFTLAELERVKRAPPRGRDELITLIWSAKEAALKAIGLGLKLDTRTVNCLIDSDADGNNGWLPFQIEIDSRHLKHEISPLQGWWRTHRDFVVCVAAETRSLESPATDEVQVL